MIHSDNETAVDLLIQNAMVGSIVETIRNEPNKPKTVGVYGDWSPGKSSVLDMVEKKCKQQNQNCNEVNWMIRIKKTEFPFLRIT